MKFGVFDHLDDSGLPLGEAYEMRLQMAEAYDRAGFHAYHIAEHHGTPLGTGPSPGIFLSAVAQRTRRLRFGPLVYLLPFYHPVRLLEEICMLDQLSGGRFELGVGRGVSPIEMSFYGLGPDDAQRLYPQALDRLLRALSGEAVGAGAAGGAYPYPDLPPTLRPRQRPHPPLWYGISSPDSTVWAARNDVNVVALQPAPAVRAVTDRYRREWAALGKPPERLPLLGIERQIVVADSDAAAAAIARRAYRRWKSAFRHLWAEHGVAAVADSIYPAEFAEVEERGMAFAGAPGAVRDFVAEQLATSGATYFVAAFAFGDITLAEAQHSVELFAGEVMPAFRRG